VEVEMEVEVEVNETRWFVYASPLKEGLEEAVHLECWSRTRGI
jgi:hypothetical protein